MTNKLSHPLFPKKDFEETGAKLEDTTGAIDYLNSVPDGKNVLSFI